MGRGNGEVANAVCEQPLVDTHWSEDGRSLLALAFHDGFGWPLVATCAPDAGGGIEHIFVVDDYGQAVDAFGRRPLREVKRDRALVHLDREHVQRLAGQTQVSMAEARVAAQKLLRAPARRYGRR